jgi:Ser/Thr protein kinase RdoA (MazF antagonist)
VARRRRCARTLSDSTNDPLRTFQLPGASAAFAAARVGGARAVPPAVPLSALENRRAHGWFEDIAPFRDALFDGYAKHCNFDAHDEALTQRLLSVRQLCMLGWLASRSDNPKIKELVSAKVSALLKQLQALK